MITSTSNIQVKELIRLQKKSRERETEGVFIAEGPRMAAEIPKERIVKLYISESFQKKCRKEKNEQFIKSAEVMSDPVFAPVSDTKTPQGVLAVVRRMEYTMEDVLGENPHVLVLENIQDPGNLGTIFRTAEAAGATGIVLSKDCVDLYNPKVIRSTMGAVLRLPFLYTDDLTGTINEMKLAGIKIYAAHLGGETDYDQEDYRTACAFLIGNEGNGLTEETAACADRKILIPMKGSAESLNAAVASAVLMFEAGRQRRRQSDKG